jgi:hypothetical protein
MSQDHRKSLRREPAPRAARRVSGPVTGRAGVAPPRPKPAQRRPPAPAAPRPSVAARARAVLASLPDHAVIDRLVRGRAWILALGVMLAGIVAMQVELLKLGASIGRSVQRSTALEIRNEQLQASVTALADDQRIERVAAGMGMVMAPPGSVGFLTARPDGNVQAALGNLHAPSATTFLNSSSTNGLVVTPTVISAANAPVGTTSTAATPSSGASVVPALQPAQTAGTPAGG